MNVTKFMTLALVFFRHKEDFITQFHKTGCVRYVAYFRTCATNDERMTEYFHHRKSVNVVNEAGRKFSSNNLITSNLVSIPTTCSQFLSSLHRVNTISSSFNKIFKTEIGENSKRCSMNLLFKPTLFLRCVIE